MSGSATAVSSKFIAALKLALHNKPYDDYVPQVHDLVEELNEHFADYRSDPDNYQLCLYADKRSLTSQHPLVAICLFEEGQARPCFGLSINGGAISTANHDFAFVTIGGKPVRCDMVDSIYLDQIM